MSKENLKIFIKICGEKNVVEYSRETEFYGKDSTMDIHFKFAYVLKPTTNKQISEILKVCNLYNIPITPRGGGSGVTGGALPVMGGIVLSLENLNKIITVNKIDGYVVAEAGVITANLCEEVENNGLYFPVIPTSKYYSFIGGNVAENAGSINSYKYGSTERYVMNLQVVLPSGDIIWTGSNVSKNSTGINLTNLFVGSEGILGVITKVVYRLVKKPLIITGVLIGLETLENAMNFLINLKTSRINIVSAEIIGETALEITKNFLGEKVHFLNKNIKINIILTLESNDEFQLNDQLLQINKILLKYTDEDFLVATSDQDKEKIWKIRMNIGRALSSNNNLYRDLDVCVPLSRLSEYLSAVQNLCENYKIRNAFFGHVLDGNLHTMIIVSKKISIQEQENIEQFLLKVYNLAVKLGGVISGEHGIGYLNKRYMEIQFSQSQLKLMNNIKKMFDPNNILNPGKVLNDLA